jgi:hypothetical protein
MTPSKRDPLDTLLTLAADVLAQVEAGHRDAVRLETGTRTVATAVRDRKFTAEQSAHLRQLLESMRATGQHVIDLTTEYERKLAALRQLR